MGRANPFRFGVIRDLQLPGTTRTKRAVAPCAPELSAVMNCWARRGVDNPAACAEATARLTECMAQRGRQRRGQNQARDTLKCVGGARRRWLLGFTDTMVS